MKNGSKPTTSQINVGQFEEAFRRHAEAGEAVLYLAFSSVLSGTYQSAVMAREMILEEFPEATIEIVDTLAAAGGEGYLSILAVEARDQGQSLEETKAMIEDILPRLRTYFLVDDLYHLMRGGRLSKGSAIIGSLVNIKPLLWIEADGKLVPIAKVRGRKKGMREMLQLASQDLAHSTAIVAYSTDLDGAQALKDSLLEDPTIDQVLIMPLGPVIATHVGPGTLAVFVIGNQAR
jgi:DegV family protein with EDD domain